MTQKKLRQGFTTGAAAAAAVKAALITLLSGKAPGQVEIAFLTGQTRMIDVHEATALSPTRARASVIKDAGDDPDITHKQEIGAQVCLGPGKPGIRIRGGKGVGRVTKPGLEVEVGQPAINSGPRQMIQEAVEQSYKQVDHAFSHQVEVEIFVPRGEELAKKTLNARLGILGGISILGTTGIVKPLSHEAYIATIASGVSVARANGESCLVFTTGRRSERFAMDIFPRFSPPAFIQTGDFFKAGIDAVVKENKRAGQKGQACLDQIIYTVFFGKAVKMALGFEHTHAAKSELTLKQLSQWALDCTKDPQLSKNIKAANTARHAFTYIYPEYPDVITLVGKKIKAHALGFAEKKVDIRVILLDFDGKIAYDSLD